MLRFNFSSSVCTCGGLGFQYITCYGLIIQQAAPVCAYPQFQYITCYGLIFLQIWS